MVVLTPAQELRFIVLTMVIQHLNFPDPTLVVEVADEIVGWIESADGECQVGVQLDS